MPQLNSHFQISKNCKNPRTASPKAMPESRSASDPGFTLIELLVVIAILVVLMGLVVGGLGLARAQAKKAEAKSDLSTITMAIQAYYTDANMYPGYRFKIVDEEEDNAFPLLFKALHYTRGDGGGPSGPYNEFKRSKTVTDLEILDENKLEFNLVVNSDFKDSKIDKWYLDPWDGVYWYRENKSKRKSRDYMINRNSFDLWTCGPDGINQSAFGLSDDEDEVTDDHGNW